MEVCVMTVKDPPDFGRKEVTTERKLPFWIPESDAHTKAKAITLTRRFKIATIAKNQQEAKMKINSLLSQIGLEIVHANQN